MSVRVGVLGPLLVEVDGASVHVTSPKQAAILGVLAVERAPVPPERLIDLVWDPGPDAHLEHTLQQHVSGLRKLLEPDRPARRESSVLPNRRGGYELVAEVDLTDFERSAAAGAADAAAGRVDAALAALDDAVGRWRGPALADVRPTSWFDAVAARLDELRLRAWESRTDVLLGQGRHAELVPELQELLAASPFREPLWARMMLALYRSGRQADALAAYGRARALLVEELGLEPGPELRRLEQQVLDQDPALDLSAPTLGDVAPSTAGLASALDAADPRATFRMGGAPTGGAVRLPDGQVVHLPPGRHVVGRQPGSAVPLADSRVSRTHAEFEVDGSRVVVRDLGSTNGTEVDGVALDGDRELRGGEVVSVGGVELRYDAL